MGFWKYLWPNAVWDIVWELAQVLTRQLQEEGATVTTVVAWVIALTSVYGACLLLYKAWKRAARIFPYVRIREMLALGGWAFDVLDRTLSSLVSGLFMVVGGEERRRELLKDLRALRQAQQQYDEAKGQDGYAASTIGVLIDKHPEIFSHVEPNPVAQKAAVEFCIAVLENHNYREARKRIQERLQHPFEVRLRADFRVASKAPKKRPSTR